ncbi:MAG TPA: hydrogenase iron-sulfur subunit [Thermodesulfobacteriota bacterium]|nr:hydrogenase iron-sulfur subunit [Thermodesulfobacteriota bacterium]
MDKETARISIFFCQRVDPKQDVNRRATERELGSRIRFYPLPCSGRIDPLQLLRAIETGADMVYLVTCGEGMCRYREGNTRAWKRLAYAQGLIEEIGLEKERLEVIQSNGQKTIDEITRSLLTRDIRVGPSPLRPK